MKFICLGDSLAYGCWDPLGGWVNRLRDYFQNYNLTTKTRHDRNWYWVFNLGVSGITSTYLAEKIPNGMLEGIKYPEEDTIVLVQIGKNDSYIIDKTGENYVSKKQFKKNITAIYKAISSKTTKVVFVTPINVDEKKLQPVPWVHEESRSVHNKEIREYNTIIKNFCAGSAAECIDLENLWGKEDYDKYLDPDGLHPNGLGHTLIFEKVRDYLLSIIK